MTQDITGYRTNYSPDVNDAMYPYRHEMLKPTAYEEINTSSGTAERILLEKVDPAVAAQVTHIDLLRIDSFIDREGRFDGVVLRSGDTVLLTIHEAIIGFDGNGPRLVKAILNWVGLNGQQAEQINRMGKIKDRLVVSYRLTIVLTRGAST